MSAATVLCLGIWGGVAKESPVFQRREAECTGPRLPSLLFCKFRGQRICGKNPQVIGRNVPGAKIFPISPSYVFCCAQIDGPLLEGSEIEGDRPSLRAEEAVTLHFLPSGVKGVAYPGDNLLALATSLGVEIPSSCCTGSCGTCEMEITKLSSPLGPDDVAVAAAGDASLVVRTCISSVPRGYPHVVVKEIEDPLWGGGDGWM